MNIEAFCKEYNLGTVKTITKLTGGLMHKMFKVETDKNIYAIKILNTEVMNREEAYNNFVISETISNLAKENNIPVSSAIKINENYLTKYQDFYYMVFIYIEGKTLQDNEITIKHCQEIGKLLAKIHSLDYKKINLESEKIKYKKLYDFEEYTLELKFKDMSYKKEYLENYKKYNSLLKRANERFNDSNNTFTICHRDMDPKNVMWKNNKPIVIDWESATLANPHRELLEDALCWSGFLSNNFEEEKFLAVFKSYQEERNIKHIDWYDVICGNLVGRFGWLKYNLERSLGIKSNDQEEMILAEKEVLKTIDEINRYINLIGTMYDLISKLINKKIINQDKEIEEIIKNNSLLKNKKYKIINSGFTNTIYQVENYIIRICTKKENEEKFANEIEFYQNNQNENIPKLIMSDKTKTVIPYYYEIIEKIEGKTLYEIWYKLKEEERKEVILKLISSIRKLHNIKVKEYDFKEYIKNKIKEYLTTCNITDELFEDLLNDCDIYFKENKFGLIHGDLHFDNIIYNKDKITLLDFEYTMPASIDYDFRILNRCKKVPWHWASVKTDMLTIENDYQNLIPIIIENYQELKEIPYLEERLLIYDTIEMLKDYKNTYNEELLKEIKDTIKKIQYNN